MQKHLEQLLETIASALAEADALQLHPQRAQFGAAELWDLGISLDRARLALEALLG